MCPITRPHPGLARALVAALSLLATACSNTQSAHNQSYAGAVQPTPPQHERIAARDDYKPEPGDPIKQAPVEPVSRRATEPDDPTEPFSPNYGKVRPGEKSPARGQIRVSDASAN